MTSEGILGGVEQRDQKEIEKQQRCELVPRSSLAALHTTPVRLPVAVISVRPRHHFQLEDTRSATLHSACLIVPGPNYLLSLLIELQAQL